MSSARLSVARRHDVIVHDGEADPTCTLILFDGEIWRGNGVGWLTRRYRGLRVVTIDAGDLGAREAELTDVDQCRGAATGSVRRGWGGACDGRGPVLRRSGCVGSGAVQ